jgi:hypothetical protein
VLPSTDGGIYNKIISGVVFVIASFNLIRGIFECMDLSRILTHTIPLFVISLLLLILNKKMIFSICFLIIGIFSATLNEETGNYAGAIFYAFSFLLVGKIYYAPIVSIITIITISINSYLNDLSFNTTINLVFAYFVIYVIFYILIYRKIKELEKKLLQKKLDQKTNIDAIGINQEEKAILKLYCRGYNYERISKTLSLNIAPSTVRRKIKAVKDDYHDRITGSDDKSIQINDAQFGKWLFTSV